MRLTPDFWNSGYRLFMGPDTGAIPGGDIPDDDDDIDKIEGLEDKGKAAIKAERKARRDAANAAKDAAAKVTDLETKMADVQKKLDDREEADRKARDKAAKEGGDFQKLAEKYEGERDQLKTDLDALQARFDALQGAAKDIVKSDFDTIPDPIKALYLGDDSDVVAMLKFVPKAKEAAKVAGDPDKPDSKEIKGAESDPPDKAKQGGNGNGTAEDDAAARAAFSRSYF